MIETKRLSQDDWAEIEARFTERQAGRKLIEESRDTAQGGALSFARLIEAAQRGTSPAALMAGGAGPIPLNAVRVFRALLARNSLGYSQQARAASSEGAIAREVGAYRIEVAFEDDATFVMIDVGGEAVPHSALFLHDDGRHGQLSLPDPVEGMIQIGLSHAHSESRELIELLKDADTSIYLH